MFKKKTESSEYRNEAKRVYEKACKALAKETLNEQLVSATRLGFLDVAKGLVRMGAEIRCSGDKPLLSAAVYDRANLAKYFLSEGGISPITDRELVQRCLSRSVHEFAAEGEETALVFINFLLLDTVKTNPQPSLTRDDFCLCFQALRKHRFPEKYNASYVSSPYASTGMDDHLDNLIEKLETMIETKP